MACFSWAKDAAVACFDGSMNIPMQRKSLLHCENGYHVHQSFLNVYTRGTLHWNQRPTGLKHLPASQVGVWSQF